MPTVWLTVLAWCLGIVGYAAYGWLVCVCALCLAALGWLMGVDRRIWVLCLCILPGAVRMASYDYRSTPPTQEAWAAEWQLPLQILDTRTDWQQQRLTVRSPNGWGAVIDVPVRPILLRGTRIQVTGAFVPFAIGSNTYTDSLLRQHIVGSLRVTAPVAVIDTSDWRVRVEAFRAHLRRRISATFAEPVAGVVVGMLLGIGSDVDPTVAQAFRASGTSHILVISGWNITIVAALCQSVLTRMGTRGSGLFVIPIVVIVTYVIGTGASAAVVRAGVMGVVIVVGKWLDRPRDMWNIIAIAVIGMSAADPTALWDLGFQLSTGATLGLIAFGTDIEALLSRTALRHPALGWAREGLGATLAAQIPTLAIMVFRLSYPSPWSLLANMIITPVVPYAMASGAAATVAALLHPQLAALVAWSALPAYHWIIDGSLAIATLPGPNRGRVALPELEWCCHLLWIGACVWRERDAIKRWYSRGEKRLKES